MSDPRPDADNTDIERAALRKEHRRTWAKAAKTYQTPRTKTSAAQ